MLEEINKIALAYADYSYLNFKSSRYCYNVLTYTFNNTIPVDFGVNFNTIGEVIGCAAYIIKHCKADQFDKRQEINGRDGVLYAGKYRSEFIYTSGYLKLIFGRTIPLCRTTMCEKFAYRILRSPVLKLVANSRNTDEFDKFKKDYDRSAYDRV